jgi:hypothetical protein
MTIECDESDDLAEAADPLKLAVGQLIVAIFDLSEEDSPARARAVSEAIEVEARIRDALRHRPQLH